MSSFLHSGAIGDIIFALPVIKKLGGGRLFLCNRPPLHPMTPEIVEALRPLLLAQPYITGVEMHKGQRVSYDMTAFRQAYDPKRTLVEAQAAHICPQKAPDLRSAWLTLPSVKTHSRAILARSGRYQNPEWDSIWPEILSRYPEKAFIGLREEYEDFCRRYGKVDYQPTSTFLEVAQLIAGSPIFIGNQSSPNAIAEGLKHTMIQETHQKLRDCIFPPRKNAHYVAWRKEWEKIGGGDESKMILMLQVYPGDVYQGKELVELLCAIEPTNRKDVEFCLAWRRDTNLYAVQDILRIASEKFGRSLSIKCKRMGVGWPNGCNDLWQSSMDVLTRMHRAKETTAECVLTFEPDCIPLRSDWINILKAEWRRAKSLGKLGFGHAHNEPKTHINGNAVFDIDLLLKHPRIGGASPTQGWDVAAGDLLLKICIDSNSIFQKYRMNNMTRPELEAIEKNGMIPALFHGIKDNSGRRIIYEMLADGTLESRCSTQLEAPVA